MSWLKTKEKLDEYRNIYREVNTKAVDEAYKRYLDRLYDVN
ncbi:hypothetical protein HYO65_gp195 [Tenacibaculum phage PTm1]|uniref:Uncharacterized protein n=1 Tax=Tenacibaculum phage PTm1 TaxID=2547425 RepID=A0A5S9BZ46_9CAUD|nr:hypothetical protein HYO65_gp195 [Tenacibaculum phage PTm1]BBI90587.1 hypothetical protein [Tenacibaculum phage PTm1]